jgi:hypothetical protein
MRRLLISTICGVAGSVGVLFLGAAAFHGFGQVGVGLFLFEPVMFLDRLGFGLNCLNADTIAEKMSCIRLSLFIDLVLYSFLIIVSSLVADHLIFRRKR